MKDPKNILLLILFIAAVTFAALYLFDRPKPTYEQEYKEAMEQIEKLRRKNFDNEMLYIERITVIQSERDSLLQENLLHHPSLGLRHR